MLYVSFEIRTGQFPDTSHIRYGMNRLEQRNEWIEEEMLLLLLPFTDRAVQFPHETHLKCRLGEGHC
jgi:hypothetical protein